VAKHKPDWREAKEFCRLNQNDIEMAKRLGFNPKVLIRSRPDPKQKWKLPVKSWIHELHYKRFGHVIGEPSPTPTSVPLHRNAGPAPTPKAVAPAPRAPSTKGLDNEDWQLDPFLSGVGDEDVPF